jgi:hypothetical protein
MCPERAQTPADFIIAQPKRFRPAWTEKKAQIPGKVCKTGGFEPLLRAATQ